MVLHHHDKGQSGDAVAAPVVFNLCKGQKGGEEQISCFLVL